MSERPAMTEGYKLVPVEPTGLMLAAAAAEEERCAVHNYGGHPSSEDIWSVMIAAAPEPLRLSEEVERIRAFLDENDTKASGVIDRERIATLNGNRLLASDLRSVLALIDMGKKEELGSDRCFGSSSDAQSVRPETGAGG